MCGQVSGQVPFMSEVRAKKRPDGTKCYERGFQELCVSKPSPPLTFSNAKCVNEGEAQGTVHGPCVQCECEMCVS